MNTTETKNETLADLTKWNNGDLSLPAPSQHLDPENLLVDARKYEEGSYDCSEATAKVRSQTAIEAYCDWETAQESECLKNEIIATASMITVINDGQVRYPVLTSELTDWLAANGPITTANYEKFCGAVDYIGSKLGTPGNSEIIDLCEALVEAGADCEKPVVSTQ